MVATMRYSFADADYAAGMFDAADAWEMAGGSIDVSGEFDTVSADFCHHDMPHDECTFCNAADDEPVALTPKTDAEIVLQIADRIGRKFTTSDIVNGGPEGTWLYETAAEWLKGQAGADFEWLADLARKYNRGGGLSDGQAKGVLNCMVAALRRERSAPAPVAVESPVQDAGWGTRTGNSVAARAEAFNREQAERSAEAEADAAYRDFLASKVSQGFYSLVREDGTHRTLKVGKWTTDRNSDARIRWISYLCGPINTADYQWFAIQAEDGTIRRTRHATDQLMNEVTALLHGTDENRANARVAYALASGTCARCNRVLTVPASIHAGVGPECAGKL